MTPRTELLIDGRWSPAGGGQRFDVHDPATGAVVATVADAGVDDALAAVAAAAAAGPGWAATPPRTRAEVLRRAYTAMTARAEEFAELITRESGKALADARGEVAYAADYLRWFAEEAVRVPGTLALTPSGSHRMLVDHQPVGVAVLVTPWNFPAAMVTRKVAPALAAGCTVVVKPAEQTPLTALALAELLAEAGVPAGVVNVVPTSSPAPTVAAMLADPRVRMLSFTGSTEVGRELLRRSADQVLKCAMELGGNAPFLVFDDADLDDALAGAMVAKLRNGGQACTAANRFLIQRGIYDAFAKGLVERMAGLRVGPGADPGTDCGPLIDAAAVAKVDRLVRDAVDRGARVLTGGEPLPGPGHFYPPTMLVDVPPGAAILAEEVFGPVAALVPFDEEAEAVRAANDTVHGLVAYVYTGDLARGLRLAGAVESGMVAVNRGLVSDAAAPFGGVKQSGLGREGGAAGLLEYLEPTYIATQW